MSGQIGARATVADFGRSRSPISEEADHPFRSKPIRHFAEADHRRLVVIA